MASTEQPINVKVFVFSDDSEHGVVASDECEEMVLSIIRKRSDEIRKIFEKWHS